MSSRAPLSVLLLTEDGGASADEALRVLVVRLLGHLVPGAVTRDDTRWWEPASPAARMIARANAWKSPRRVDRVRFLQYIAAKLRQEHGFVLFHVDGDRPHRERAESENRRKFDTMIRQPVGSILTAPPPRRRRGPAAERVEAVDLDVHLGKLVLLMPFYSIEAWLYQNTEVAARLCPGEPRCRLGCAELLERWRRDRGALDEVLRPKRALCLGSDHNVALAGAGYPLAEVLAAGKSLHEAVEGLRSCAALLGALHARAPAWQQ